MSAGREAYTWSLEEIARELAEVRQAKGREKPYGPAYWKLVGREQMLRRMEEAVHAERKAYREQLRAAARQDRDDAMALAKADGTLPYAPDSATSRAAARRARDEAGSLRVAVLAYLLMRPSGLTDQQIQRDMGLPGNTERPRRRELVERGLVYDSGRTRQTRKDAETEATVWVAWKHAPAALTQRWLFEDEGDEEVAA